jgi:hypothetical protein
MQYLNAMLDELKNELMSPELDPTELIDAYRYPINITLKLDIHKKPNRCQAFISQNKQCNRLHTVDSKFCITHEGHTNPDRKRGRQTKNTISLENLDLCKYIQAIRIKINNESYLVDEHDIVYKLSRDNEIVGKLFHISTGDVIKWF